MSLTSVLILSPTAVGAQSLSPLTTLYSFTGNSDGEYPRGTLIQGTDGNLYGTSSGGGTAVCNDGQPCQGSEGAIFKITTNGTFTSLYTFTCAGTCPNCTLPNGAQPMSGLVQGTDGNLYGTTCYGGTSTLFGTLFRFTPSTGTLTLLYNFDDGANGGWPTGGLVQGTDGNLYGTTFVGGANAINQMYGGTVFKFSLATGTLTTLYSFTANPSNTDGGGPAATLIQASDGVLYGTTCDGATSTGSGLPGTVFKITTAGTFNNLYSFTGDANGSSPSGLIQGSDGNLYGEASGGGVYNDGTVFKITTNGTLTTVYTFTDNSVTFDGAGPVGGLAQGNDGNFYGVTGSGPYLNVWASDVGTVFVITPSGQLTTLYAFSGTNGISPGAGLVQASDGNLYGTTLYGGVLPAFSQGSLFKMFPLNHHWSITNTLATPGSGSWTCPADIYHVTIETWGAGGGGGSATNSSPGYSGGGGGGAYSRLNLFQTQPGSSYAYTVGAGGITDNPGGNSMFENLSSVPVTVAAGGAQGTENASGQGGQTSVGTGDVKFSGGHGSAGSNIPSGPTWSGPGGGAAGNAGNGGSPSPSYNSTGGAGGVSGGGNGGTSWERYYSTIESFATNGVYPGGGGAGAIGTILTATPGANGVIKVSY